MLSIFRTIAIVFLFPVSVAPCVKECPPFNFPVCGTDSVTYMNICELQNASCKKTVALKNEGVCLSKCYVTKTRYCSAPCGKVFNPLCGNNNRTYPSDCHMEAINCYLPADQKITPSYCGMCKP
ncbi:serine protease inhibitor dipetalogastin-like [Physella acuta]|uniref:serine protease inhibitor dipetalogastin-like n=1 Tax=Physella acuta TaxID=109671 RepID=UPI0027DEA844|nr:serine protease inhibitor dipetalogastin-like [Physella acuta]